MDLFVTLFSRTGESRLMQFVIHIRPILIYRAEHGLKMVNEGSLCYGQISSSFDPFKVILSTGAARKSLHMQAS